MHEIVCYVSCYTVFLGGGHRFCHNWRCLANMTSDCVNYQCEFMVTGAISNLVQILSCLSSACFLCVFLLPRIEPVSQNLSAPGS
jgi:hypothetical protein